MIIMSMKLDGEEPLCHSHRPCPSPPQYGHMYAETIIIELAAGNTGSMQQVFLVVHPEEILIAVIKLFNAAANSEIPVWTIWCWNQAM